MNVSSPAGFAVVKLATDRKSGEEFAVKIMALPEPNAKAGDNENTRCTPHQYRCIHGCIQSSIYMTFKLVITQSSVQWSGCTFQVSQS